MRGLVPYGLAAVLALSSWAATDSIGLAEAPATTTETHVITGPGGSINDDCLLNAQSANLDAHTAHFTEAQVLSCAPEAIATDGYTGGPGLYAIRKGEDSYKLVRAQLTTSTPVKVGRRGVVYADGDCGAWEYTVQIYDTWGFLWMLAHVNLWCSGVFNTAWINHTCTPLPLTTCTSFQIGTINDWTLHTNPWWDQQVTFFPFGSDQGGCRQYFDSFWDYDTGGWARYVSGWCY
jgi:hypothetical protein